MNITLRFAAPSDAAKLIEIYRPYVEGTTVTFEYDTPSEEEFSRRIVEFSRDFPYLVCESDGEVIGYAYAHRYGERFSFRFSTELSIYLAPSARGKGVGTRLYGALIELLTLMGYKNLYALVSCPNPESFAFHEKFGFKEVGRANGVGYKFGKWIDLATLERVVGDKDDTEDRALWHACPKRIGDIDAAPILRKYALCER
ncbi:MAG: N-acetyltransferase [Clostridia bacterium]|nr:N-acetyltransferase [Clostridia bacterium]